MKFRLPLLIAVLSLSFLFVTEAFAKHNSPLRPGWGFGDTNHIHTGPPGRSVSVNVVQNNSATISNNVNVVSNTGGNSINGSTGGSNSIVTGASTVVVRVRNFVNQNILNF